MNIVVFLGPTLSIEAAERVLPATYLPPVACGDIQSVMRERPDMIGIIDGFFGEKPSVFHKEILFALSEGVRVFGSSSMGALRAAELHTFGMTGVGSIFRMYRDGELEDDDEVAIVHGDRESGYAPYSDAMVNLRDGLRIARERDVISETTRAALVALAKRCFYAERSWARLYRAAHDAGIDLGGLPELVAREQPNLKRTDALELLEAMARASDQPLAEPAFTFARTIWWQRLRGNVEHASRYGRRPSHPVPPRVFAAHAMSRCDATLRREALLFALAAEVAEARGIDVTDDEIASELLVRGLERTPSTAALVRSELTIDELMGAMTAEVATHVPSVLQARGRLADAIAYVEAKWQWLHERGLSRPSLRDVDLAPDALLAWYRDHLGSTATSASSLAGAAGVAEGELLEAALREYLYQRRSS